MALLPVILFEACGHLPGDLPKDVRAVGVLVDADHMPGDPLVVPDTVDVGVAFEATVTTMAPADCWKADGADVNVSGLTAEIVPYDASPTAGECMAIVVYPEHVVSITFGQAGLATVRARGRQYGTGVGTPPLVVIEKQVVVR
jgi:hypothetical protein